jgi:uncharacterized protein (DUF1015 family)
VRLDGVPALYVYVQDYSEDGRQKSRIGFLAAMKLEERMVLRHENTLERPKQDRLALLKEVQTNLSPIFGLFEDSVKKVGKLLGAAVGRGRPEVDVRIDGVRHRLYVEDRPEICARIENALRKKPMFIADGHHRFEVTCQYKRWRRIRKRGSGEKEWEYAMVYFSDAVHNPYKIYPTHRLIRLTRPTDLWTALEKIGSFKKVSGLDAILSGLSKPRRESKDQRYQFGFYSRGQGFSIFTLQSAAMRTLGKSPVNHLDVAVLHEKLLKPFLRSDAVGTSDRIDFTRDATQAVHQVKHGFFDVAVFLRPTSLAEVLLVSRKGLKMPQKSTYFYPKLLSGLVFHGFEPFKKGDSNRT